MLCSTRALLKVGIFGSLLTSLLACHQSPKDFLPGSGSNQSGIIRGSILEASDDFSVSALQSTVAIGTAFSGNFCTGTLVAKNLVLTAGHCVKVVSNPQMLQIFFGSDLSSASHYEKRQVLGGQISLKTDLALLKFSGQLPAGFQPVRLLGNLEPLKTGMEVTLLGYGKTNMNPDTNPEKLMQAQVRLSNPNFSSSELLFEQFEGKGACHGDSGGPAFAMINQKIFLIGVANRSATEAGATTCLDGSIYISVPSQIEFLKTAARYLNSDQFIPGHLISPAALSSTIH